MSWNPLALYIFVGTIITLCMSVWIETRLRVRLLCGGGNYTLYECMSWNSLTLLRNMKTSYYTLYECMSWNPKVFSISGVEHYYTLYECMNWNSYFWKIVFSLIITLCTIVWIETLSVMSFKVIIRLRFIRVYDWNYHRRPVRPKGFPITLYTSVWVKISAVKIPTLPILPLHSIRVYELKLGQTRTESRYVRITLCTSVWVKIRKAKNSFTFHYITLCTSVWVETVK